MTFLAVVETENHVKYTLVFINQEWHSYFFFKINLNFTLSFCGFIFLGLSLVSEEDGKKKMSLEIREEEFLSTF